MNSWEVILDITDTFDRLGLYRYELYIDIIDYWEENSNGV